MTNTQILLKRHRRSARTPFQRVDHTLEPWEKRAHFLATVLDLHKIINMEEWGRRVEALGTELVGALSYYERSLATFANILFQKRIIMPIT